jgi:hypothetical protein
MFGALMGLIPLITQVMPAVTAMMGTPVAGSILLKAANVAEHVFGTTDATEIQAQIAQDANKLAAFKAELEARTKVDIQYFEDTQSARAMTATLAEQKSPLAWGSAIMTILVTIGFFIVLTMFVIAPLDLPEFQKTVLNVLVGYLGAAFSQGVNFWLGTTRASGEKTLALTGLAAGALQKIEQQTAPAPQKMFR